MEKIFQIVSGYGSKGTDSDIKPYWMILHNNKPIASFSEQPMLPIGIILDNKCIAIDGSNCTLTEYADGFPIMDCGLDPEYPANSQHFLRQRVIEKRNNINKDHFRYPEIRIEVYNEIIEMLEKNVL